MKGGREGRGKGERRTLIGKLREKKKGKEGNGKPNKIAWGE